MDGYEGYGPTDKEDAAKDTTTYLLSELIKVQQRLKKLEKSIAKDTE